jgi:hypothetical protein
MILCEFHVLSKITFQWDDDEICFVLDQYDLLTPMFFFIFNDIRWEVAVRFVGIGGIVDHHCLNILGVLDSNQNKYILYFRCVWLESKQIYFIF